MKKILSLAFCMVTLFTVAALPAYAAEPTFGTSIELATPRWTNCVNMAPYISFPDGSYSCSINAIKATTKISATLILYQKNWLGIYSEVDRTSDTANAAAHLFSGSYSFESGKTYRLVVNAEITANGYTESVSTSTVQTY